MTRRLRGAHHEDPEGPTAIGVFLVFRIHYVNPAANIRCSARCSWYARFRSARVQAGGTVPDPVPPPARFIGFIGAVEVDVTG